MGAGVEDGGIRVAVGDGMRVGVRVGRVILVGEGLGVDVLVDRIVAEAITVSWGVTDDSTGDEDVTDISAIGFGVDKFPESSVSEPFREKYTVTPPIPKHAINSKASSASV